MIHTFTLASKALINGGDFIPEFPKDYEDIFEAFKDRRFMGYDNRHRRRVGHLQQDGCLVVDGEQRVPLTPNNTMISADEMGLKITIEVDDTVLQAQINMR